MPIDSAVSSPQIENQAAENNGTETVIAPPLPPTIKTPIVQRGKGQIQPVEYETTIKQTVRPSPNSTASAAVSNGEPGGLPNYNHLPPDSRTCAETCWKLFTEKPAGWELRLTRITPPYEDSLPVPQGPFEDVIAYVHQLPQAMYRLRFRDSRGFFGGPTLQPIIDTRTNGESPHQRSTQRVYQAVLPGTDKLVWHKDGQPMTEKEVDAERTVRGYEREHGPISEVERLRMTRTILQEKRATEEERRELERERGGGEATALVKPLQEVTATLAAMRQEIASMKEAPKGPSMVELLTAMTPIITALIGSQSGKGAEVNQAINLIIETNKGMMQQQLEQLRDMKQTAERLIEKQSSNPEAHIKMLLDMQEKGEERAMKMFELMRPADDKDDDVNIDPSNVWGSLAAEGVKALIGAFKSGGPEIVKMIADRVGKPPQQVTEQDLVALNSRLRQMPTVQQRPAQFMPGQVPATVQRLPMAQNPPPVASVATFDPTSAPLQSQSEKAIEGVTVTVPPQQPAESSAQANVAPTQPEQIITVQPTAPVASASQTVIQAVPTTDNLIEHDLREFIDVCCREYMLVDLKTERQEHEWPYYATQKWHKDFKMKLVLVETHDQRMDILKEKMDSALFAEIMALWKKEGSGNFYNLQVAWNTFITETMKPPEAAASEATATAQPVTGGQ